MMLRTPLAKGVSLLASGLIISGGVWLAAPDLEIRIEGGGESAQARMGTSFQDMVQGTLVAQPVEDITPPEPVQQAAVTPPAASTPRVSPSQSSSVQHVQPSMSVPPVGPDAVVVTSLPTPTPSAAPSQTLTAQDPQTAAPPQSMRPKRKDPAQAARVAAARPKQETAKPASTPKVARGNAQRNNTQGAQTNAIAQARAASRGTAKKASAQAGNAAASNYPGQVMRRIARVPKPRVKVRGTTVVAFAVSSGGGLAGVSVARSSGSSALDQAALRVIRKAAPFPKPPRGARRQFSIRIKGR